MLAALALATTAVPTADEVSHLPGYAGSLPAPQFSGFLDASASEPGTHLHYWFAACSAAGDWKEKPVVLWLNGGPGSSSLIGMLQEQGPLIIDEAGGLIDNPWAWTTVANMVAIESPGGVGFSYCAEMKSGGACINTDVSTARAAAAAVQDFFTSKFPELRANPFFITGESCAPMLPLRRCCTSQVSRRATHRSSRAVCAARAPQMRACIAPLSPRSWSRQSQPSTSSVWQWAIRAQTTMRRPTRWTCCGGRTRMAWCPTPSLTFCGIRAKLARHRSCGRARGVPKRRRRWSGVLMACTCLRRAWCR